GRSAPRVRPHLERDPRSGGARAAGVELRPVAHGARLGARLPLRHHARRAGGDAVSAGRTPSQTIGPFFAVALPWPDGPRVVAEGTPGAIRIEGRVLDGIAGPVPDALVETWQRTPRGIRGFGRCPTDADGRWAIVTLKPEASPPGGAGGAGGGRREAPHIAVSVFARGLLKRVITRI